MLSDWLPYRVFDESAGLYRNARSKGFILEVTPLIGADERTGEILGQFFSEGLPQGACLQVLNFASPRIGQVVSPWFAPRYEQGGIYEAIARERIARFYDLVWESGSAHAPFHVRSSRLIVSLGRTGEFACVTDAELAECREGLLGLIHSLGLEAHALRPSALIGLIDELTSPTTAREPERELEPARADRRPGDPRRYRARGRGRPHGAENRAVPRDRPRQAPAIPKSGNACPTASTCATLPCARSPNAGRRGNARASSATCSPTSCAFLVRPRRCSAWSIPTRMRPRRGPATSSCAPRALSQTKSARFLPKLADQSAEWRHVQNELQAGKKLVKLFYGLTSYSPLGHGRRARARDQGDLQGGGLGSRRRALSPAPGPGCGFPLKPCRWAGRRHAAPEAHAHHALDHGGQYRADAGRVSRPRVPHLLLVGRRGQPFWWSPFENGAGNHNIAICGKSGSGKSVLLQELCAALRGAGAKVVVIDDGRSFEHSVKLQGGRFVEFTLAAGFSLNPFSMVDDARASSDEDYRLDCFAMIKAIIGQMARHERQAERHRARAHRPGGDDRLGHARQRRQHRRYRRGALSAGGGELGTNLATAIAPYCRGGSYGGFFSGKASFALDDDFTVFEMSDLASREELRSVVLSAIMFMTGQAMTRTSRSNPQAAADRRGLVDAARRLDGRVRRDLCPHRAQIWRRARDRHPVAQ
jgi:conjugal transfer ATP-binding protein TraC